MPLLCSTCRRPPSRRRRLHVASRRGAVTYWRCRPCAAERMRAYYATRSGRQAVRAAKARYRRIRRRLSLRR